MNVPRPLKCNPTGYYRKTVNKFWIWSQFFVCFVKKISANLKSFLPLPIDFWRTGNLQCYVFTIITDQKNWRQNRKSISLNPMYVQEVANSQRNLESVFIRFSWKSLFIVVSKPKDSTAVNYTWILFIHYYLVFQKIVVSKKII